MFSLNMMVHPPDEGTQAGKDTLNLAGMSKLPVCMNISRVNYWPPLVNALVDGSSIGSQFAAGLYFLEQKVGFMLAVGKVYLWHTPG